MRTLTIALLVAAAGLARTSSAQVPRPLPPARTTDTANTVTVRNQRTTPATVFLEHGQFDRRLGVVAPGATATLPVLLPGWAVRGRAEVRLFAHVEGDAGDLTTQRFALSSPARLAMTIPSYGDMVSPPEQRMTEVIPPEQLAEATITVDNPRDQAVTVYAERGSYDVRLGRVPARGRATLSFPTSVVFPDESIEIFVHPDGGRDLASQRFQVARGKHLGLRVPTY